MTDTTLPRHHLAQEVQNVSVALRELAGATRRLLAALFTTRLQHKTSGPVPTAKQEADKLRAYADTVYLDDPRYAQDLYMAAIRHELTARAN